MEIDAKTLVLIDNSLSVSKVNREIAKLTLKYLFEHSPENRAYCFMPFSHDFDYKESYTVDYIGLSDMTTRLEYENKEVSISDVLTETLDRWQESDYACRDIIIITDGNEEAAKYHDRDELYYMLQQTEYPVYIIMLDQDDNESAVKNLNAICRLSEGELFHTEFEGSDAEVERQVSEALLSSMERYARDHWEVYSESDTISENVDNSGDGTGENDSKESVENEEKTGNSDEINNITSVIEEDNNNETAYMSNRNIDAVMQTQSDSSFWSPLTYAIIGASLFMAICGVFLSWCLIQKRKKQIEREDESYRNIIRKQMEDRCGDSIGRDHNYEKGYNDSSISISNAGNSCINGNSYRKSGMGETIAIVERNDFPDNDGSTRLLYSDSDVADMIFEDANDPSRYYRITSHKRITLGRTPNCCDIAFDYDDSVSARHCEMYSREGVWYVKDLDSSNGTFVNGEKVYTELEINNGDLLKMGTLSLIVRF